MKAPWKDGKMVSQMKLKNEFECTLKVVDWKPHSRNPEWVGSLRCQSLTSNLHQIYTSVGSGLNEIDGHSLNRKQGPEAFMGKLIEVKAECISKHEALQLPRITGFRFDKDQPDTFAEVEDAYNDSIALGRDL